MSVDTDERNSKAGNSDEAINQNKKLEDVLEGERRAVVIGINEYKDKSIHALSGAVHDAEEICERLENFGNFKVTKLCNDEGGCEAIRMAISDLLCQSNPCKLALLYFSGHGFVDKHGNGYIAPHDMLVKHPFVCGINMLDLQRLMLDSENKSSVLMILDCCYSGIPTKETKEVQTKNFEYIPFFEKFEKAGEQSLGKIILASSEADKVSSEEKVKHENGQEHHHGIFTFHLIEGLDGKAADPAGIITFDRLKNHVMTQLEQKGKQKPKYFAADASMTERIKIAVVSKQIKEYVENKTKEAEEHYDNYTKMGNLNYGDPVYLILALEKTHDVLENNPKYPKALDIKYRINEKLIKMQENVSLWLAMNELNVKPQIPAVFPVLETIGENMCFDYIENLDQRKKLLLKALCKVTCAKIQLAFFVTQCRQLETSSTLRPGAST